MARRIKRFLLDLRCLILKHKWDQPTIAHCQRCDRLTFIASQYPRWHGPLRVPEKTDSGGGLS